MKTVLILGVVAVAGVVTVVTVNRIVARERGQALGQGLVSGLASGLGGVLGGLFDGASAGVSGLAGTFGPDLGTRASTVRDDSGCRQVSLLSRVC